MCHECRKLRKQQEFQEPQEALASAQPGWAGKAFTLPTTLGLGKIQAHV